MSVPFKSRILEDVKAKTSARVSEKTHHAFRHEISMGVWNPLGNKVFGAGCYKLIDIARSKLYERIS